MESDLLVKELSADGVLLLKLNRPDKKNAISSQMYVELSQEILLAERAPDVRCLVLAGEGDCFCAGADLAEAGQSRPSPAEVPSVVFLQALSRCCKPVLACVSGPAVGIGMTMLLHCDLVYASPEARFGVPFSKLGLTPEGASSLLLTRLFGRQKASRLLLLGETVSAEEASNLGLVTELFPKQFVLRETLLRASRLAALPPGAVGEAKRLMTDSDKAAVTARLVEEMEIFNAYLQSEPAQRIRQEFLAKRGQ